ncbi:MAG: 50S ribosomal protein L35 [Phycisphaerae bacterium]|jgi:large subunit ribosomal protein L35
MPKMKSHKGTKKRVRVTAKGKVRHKRANAGHLMSGKSGSRRRGLRKPGILKSAFRERLKVALAGAKA